MDKQDLRTLQILEELNKDEVPSQRELAGQLNISLGLVNSFIKRLSHKGYFKVTTIPKNRVSYILTPKGFAEKTRLTYEYIQFSYRFYRQARQKLQTLFKGFENEDINTLVFYGASDFAEIAYLSLMETNIKLCGIVDEDKAGDKFFNLDIGDPKRLKSITYDRILLTADNSQEDILNKLAEADISLKKVVSPI